MHGDEAVQLVPRASSQIHSLQLRTKLIFFNCCHHAEVAKGF